MNAEEAWEALEAIMPRSSPGRAPLVSNEWTSREYEAVRLAFLSLVKRLTDRDEPTQGN